MANVEMNVALGEGVRRLPIYLLLDCSGSMSGAPIESVRRGVEAFAQEVSADTFASQTVHVGVITFDSDARIVTNGLTPIEQFQPPQLSASGSTALGRAFQVLQQSLDTDVKSSVKGGEKGDWKPLIFILTDGMPDPGWETPRQEILKRQQRKVINVITVGCGPSINEQNLKAIATGPTFRMDNSEASFKTFFQWVSQSVKAVSKSVSQPGGDAQPAAMPNPPNILQYVP